MLRRILPKILLLLASMLVCASVIELGLRFAHPRYASAAAGEYDRDMLRIWSPRPNRRLMLSHPDTGAEHPVVYNDRALRQSRNFPSLDGAVNVGVFGDSYTENVALPAMHVFTELLDHLLNESGRRFNVLNFGVNGYGTDQSYLHFLDFVRRDRLDHVVYVLCANDLRNIFENELFSLAGDGQLVKSDPTPPGWWVRTLARLHITYLAMDISQRVFAAGSQEWNDHQRVLAEQEMFDAFRDQFETPRAKQLEASLLEGSKNDDLERTIPIFQTLLERWREASEEIGADFRIVLLPTGREDSVAAYIDDSFEVISLYHYFDRVIDEYDWTDIRFENDRHWAERGNMLAARRLYRLLEPEGGATPISDDELDWRIARYYAAFPGAWRPPGVDADRREENEELSAIRAKYLELELH